MGGRLSLSILAILLAPLAARAEIFVLAGKGEIRGELLNKTEAPREKYVIGLPGGGEVTLDKDQVTDVRRETPAQLEYERRRAITGDTVEDQWTLAEYCRQNHLLSHREEHLRRILQLSPDHERARLALGYTRTEGTWRTTEEIMRGRGYVRYKGGWKLPEEVELLESRRNAEREVAVWKTNIKRWRGWLEDKAKAEKALEQIRKIDDTSAIPGIKAQLAADKDPKLRKLWLEVLGQIDAPAARAVLVEVSLEDADLEVRLSAVDELVKSKDRDVVNQYVKALKSTNNPTINRAAVGLAAMEDKSAVGPLIDALVTSHKKVIQQGSGQISSTFSTGPGGGPGGLSVGSSVKVIIQTLANEDVRTALVQLSGVNFNFDLDRWKAWHAAQRQDAAINVRRE